MDVLNNKFELPITKEELRKRQADERININTRDESKIGTSFKDLKELDVTNKVEQPIASVRKTPEPTPTPQPKPEAKPEPVPTPSPDISKTKSITPQPEKPEEPKPKPPTEETPLKPEEEEEEEAPKGNPKNILLQFNWTKPPPGLINMPNDASNLDMMRVGAGPENIQGAGQQRAWSILDIMDEEDDLFLYETIKGLFNRAEGRKTTQTYASGWRGIFKRVGHDWVKVGEENPESDVTRLTVLDNSLFRTRRGNEIGSPVDVYNIDEDTWSSYAGDVPFDEVGPYAGDYVTNSCVHNGELYLTSAYYVWKSTIVDEARVWSKFYDGIIGHNDRDGVPLIDDITSDGNDIFIIAGMNYFPIGGYATEIFKVTATDYTKLAKISDNRKPSTLDYESYTEKLYASTTDTPASKIFKIDRDGTSEELMTLDDRYYCNGVATGSMFGYLSAGKKIYRLGKDQDPTEIYSSDNADGQQFLTSYEEQIGIGANGKIFHTEMEGSVVRAVRRGEDSKYPT